MIFNLFENSKYLIFTFLVTIILGYFLGITVASTVDYRIKDAVIHMPQPKNNIRVIVSKKPNKVKVNHNKKEIENFLNYKNVPKKIYKKKKIKRNIDKSYPFNSSLLKQEHLYSNNLIKHDKRLSKYYQYYQKSKKIKKKSKYNAYNSEQLEDDYTHIDKDKYPIDHINNKIYSPKGKNEKYTENSDFPIRNKLCPDFKCQRNYMTCTSSHKAKFSKPFVKDVPQIILNKNN